MNARQQRFYTAWLHTNYTMTEEEWKFIAILALLWIYAFPLGFAIGMMIAYFI